MELTVIGYIVSENFQIDAQANKWIIKTVNHALPNVRNWYTRARYCQIKVTRF